MRLFPSNQSKSQSNKTQHRQPQQQQRGREDGPQEQEQLPVRGVLLPQRQALARHHVSQLSAVVLELVAPGLFVRGARTGIEARVAAGSGSSQVQRTHARPAEPLRRMLKLVAPSNPTTKQKPV